MILPNEPIDALPPAAADASAPSHPPSAHDELLSARESLRQSQLELRALANSIPQLAWIAEQDGTMVWYNQRWYDYTGTTPEQMAGDGWKQVYAPDCMDAMQQRWEESRNSGEPFELEVPIRSADGEFRWFLTRANPVHSANGEVLRWFGTSTDVDQVKRVQEALRDETAVLELLNPPVRSYLAVPVWRTGEVLGTMFFGHPEPACSPSAPSASCAALRPRPRWRSTTRACTKRPARRRGTQGAARERTAGARRGRTHQPDEGRIPGHPVARAAHPAVGHPRLGPGAAPRQPRPERPAKGLQTIERNARAQAQLIEDLLDMSRITSGKVLLDMQPVAPAGFIDAAIETVRPAADAKNIRIEKHLRQRPRHDRRRPGAPAAGGLEPAVERDQVHAARRPGRVVLAASATPMSRSPCATTAPASPEFITHVFERFRQADASMTRKHGGLGLGLAIVKHLIEQHGGTVRAESAGEGRGASFTIELPLAKQQPRRRPRRPRAAMIRSARRTPDMTVRDLAGRCWWSTTTAMRAS
jgi:PAS domain S-box-containing protein